MDQNMYRQILQLKTQLEGYIAGQEFEPQFTFGYFLKEYISRQQLSVKAFATNIGVSHAAISQYTNDRRKPTPEFMIRLELHSQGLFPALSWMRLLHKEKEHSILTNQHLRREQREYILQSIDLTGT